MIRLGIIMDPISSIVFDRDSSLCVLQEAARQGCELFYMEQQDLFLKDAQVFAFMRRLKVYDNPHRWFEFYDADTLPLSHLNLILMRKDPPFDMNYIMTTYLLEFAERAGVRVVNKPQALRDVNEKLSTALFPECCPPTLVSARIGALRAFWQEQGDIICKPLDSMAGDSIFRVQSHDVNASVIFETITRRETRPIMAQRFIPDITTSGDKRILLIHGEAVPYALARIPALGETRGNLVAGATATIVELTERDHWICKKIGPTLQKMGLSWIGIDVIGDFVTEINVTSPSCLRTIEQARQVNIAKQFLDPLFKL